MAAICSDKESKMHRFEVLCTRIYTGFLDLQKLRGPLRNMLDLAPRMSNSIKEFV